MRFIKMNLLLQLKIFSDFTVLANESLQGLTGEFCQVGSGLHSENVGGEQFPQTSRPSDWASNHHQARSATDRSGRHQAQAAVSCRIS